MRDNYFRTRTGHMFFFNNADSDDIRFAYDRAMATAVVRTNICVYRVPGVSGPWDRIAVVGHRHRGEILSDLSIAQDADEIEKLENELGEISRRYQEVGRILPPQAVSAA